MLSIDFEFPAKDVTSLVAVSKGEVARGVVMVLQLAPLYLSQSAKEKEKEMERDKVREREREKEKERGKDFEGGSKTYKLNRAAPQPFSLKRTFYVLYRPGHECPEFLIKRQQMQQSLAYCWHLNRAPRGINGVSDITEVGYSKPGFSGGTRCEAGSRKGNADNSSKVTERRFSCTYDNGEVWSGRVVRLGRDSNGIPLWSGKLEPPFFSSSVYLMNESSYALTITINININITININSTIIITITITITINSD